jgi:hypothetical protein
MALFVVGVIFRGVLPGDMCISAGDVTRPAGALGG